MPALPSSVIEPLWDQFCELLPDRVDTHPLGCHRPRIPDRVVFDKLVQVQVQVLVYGDITVHLDAGYDSGKTRDILDELGRDHVISTKGFPLHADKRWVVERTNSWHNRGFKKLAICTERHTRVIEAFIALSKHGHHHPAAARRGLAHPPLGHPTGRRP